MTVRIPYLTSLRGAVAFAIFTSSLILGVTLPAEISAYSCGHCYGANQWNTNMWIQPQTYNAYFQNTPSPTDPGNSGLIQNPPVSSKWYAYPSQSGTYGGTWRASCIC